MSSSRGTVRDVLIFAVAVVCATIAACGVSADGADATPPADPAAILQIHPGGGPSRFGDSQALEAEVSHPSGAAIDGVEVDFEVTGGPGDRDGNSPQTPDMTCTTAGGDAHHPATCTVSYAEQSNQGGSDGVLAWIDSDQQDSTVEADLGEGENENAPGTGGCAADTKGPGDVPEPDATDCVEKRWLARAATTVELEPKATSGSVGSVVSLAATVRDQFGDPFGSLDGSSTTVSFELLAGSAHDPGDGSDFSTPDLGSCTTGPDGSCSVPFSETTGGDDVVCAYLPGASAACSQAPDASGAAQGAQVVTRSWEAPTAPATSDPGSGTPPAPATGDSQPTDPTQSSDQSKDGAHDSTPHPHDSGAADRAHADEPTRTGVSHSAVRSTAAAHTAKSVHAARPRPQRVRHAHPRGRSHSGPATPRGRSAGPPSAPGRPAQRPLRHRRRHAVASIGALSRAALTTAHNLSFPLALTLLVITFLSVQGRIDRRDPKLRLAPVDSKHDLLPFT